jgi:hypothetical protein
MLLNGIEDVIGRPDLADRAIVLTLPAISDAQRRPEVKLWAYFEGARPGILGALLDIVAHGLMSPRRTPPIAPAYGGFCALDGRLRNSALAHGHHRACLCGQSTAADRMFHRRRSRGGLRSRYSGEPRSSMGRNRLRLPASRRQAAAGRGLNPPPRLATHPAGARWPPASSPNILARRRHRYRVSP